MQVAPVLAKPSLGALRVLLASLGPTSSRADRERAAVALVAAGIEISNDWGQYHDADDVIDALGVPDVYEAGCRFQDGYCRAAQDYWYADNGCDDGGERLPESECDGADFFRAVYDGIERAIEAHQYRDFGSLPSDMRRAAE